jgi:hypothetical protein
VCSGASLRTPPFTGDGSAAISKARARKTTLHFEAPSKVGSRSGQKRAETTPYIVFSQAPSQRRSYPAFHEHLLSAVMRLLTKPLLLSLASAAVNGPCRKLPPRSGQVLSSAAEMSHSVKGKVDKSDWGLDLRMFEDATACQCRPSLAGHSFRQIQNRTVYEV